MTEAEALKQFIPILGRISPPGERATITRNILERIAGKQTGIMGVSHKQAGALAWPRDPVKASEYENALDVAVDAGDFVSLLHRADRRHFQIEELTSWPDCPAISPDSPLTFWLGEPAPAQTSTMPAPVVAREFRIGNVLKLPNGHTHVPAVDLPLMIADAQYPDDGTDDEGWETNHANCEIDSENEIKEAVQSGALPLKKPSTLAPLTYLKGRPWKSGLVTVADLRIYLAERGMTLSIAGSLESQAEISSASPAVAAGASGGVEPGKAGPAKPLQRTAAQDSAILCEIEKQGYDPLALPKNPPGKSGVKAAIRASLSKNSLFTGGTVFDKAWERLTARADIAIQG